MASILTQKQQEAVEACEKMKQSFVNLNSQINITHNNGFKPLKNDIEDEYDLENQMLIASIDMNDLSIEQ